MQSLSGLSHLYQLEPLKTERLAAKFIDKLMDDNRFVGLDDTFVNFPWSVMINHGIKMVIPPVTNGFVVCQHIYFREMIPQWKEIGVKVVFTPHCEEHFIDGLEIRPFPHWMANPGSPHNRRDIYDVSFIGASLTHWTRRYIMGLEPTFWTENNIRFFGLNTGKWHFEQPEETKRNHFDLFRSVMRSSNFALCPRGTGPGTIRFWEALSFGTIPIVIANGWKLPDAIYEWDDVIVRIPESENEIIKLPEIIHAIKNVPDRQAKCLALAAQFQHEGFITPILQYLSDKLK